MTYTKSCETCGGQGILLFFIDSTDDVANIEYESCEDCDGKGEIWIEEND